MIIIYQICSLTRDWSKRTPLLNMPQLKLGNIRVIFHNFQKCASCEKDLKDDKHEKPPFRAKVFSNVRPWTLSVFQTVFLETLVAFLAERNLLLISQFMLR